MRLSSGFKDLKEGRERLLTITKATYDAKFDKARINFRDEDGGTGVESFLFVNASDEPNEVALNLFSTLVKCALHDWSLEEFDDWDSLTGCQVLADVTRTPSKDGERMFTNVGRYKEAPIEDDDLSDIL